MNRLRTAAVLLIIASSIPACVDDELDLGEEDQAATSYDYASIAAYWAPIVYQDTNPMNGKPPRCDYITNFDYDLDYRGSNNWENLFLHPGADYTYPTYAYVYYSVTQTTTHWFIGYYFFHAQDCDGDPHENDLEGMLLAVRRDGSTNGTLEHMVTLAHDFYYQYSNAGATSGTQGVDGGISCKTGNCADGHPKIFIEDTGHGVFGCTPANCDSAPGGNGLVFGPEAVSEYPGHSGAYDGTDNYHPSGTDPVGYKLIAMDSHGTPAGDIASTTSRRQGFWYLQNYICPTCTFDSYGVMKGDRTSCVVNSDCGLGLCLTGVCDQTENSAKAPWAWDSNSDGEVFTGDMICDPAALFDIQLNSLGLFSHIYTDHRYWTHKLEYLRAMPKMDFDSDAYAADEYFYVTAEGVPSTNLVLDDRAWKQDNVALNAWSLFMQYGQDDATGETEYGDVVNSHFYCRQTKSYTLDGNGTVVDSANAGPHTVVTAYDSDGLSAPASDHLLFSAIALSGSQNGSCNFDDDTLSPPQWPNDHLPLSTYYDFSCDSAGITSDSNARVSFALTRAKRPDVASSWTCSKDGGNRCFDSNPKGYNCLCTDACRAANNCCADKTSVCGGW